MAFKSTLTAGIGTSETAITDTVSAGTTHTLIGVSLANVTTGNITANVILNKNGGSSAYMVKGAIIPVGGALIVVGGDQKLVVEEGDSVGVVSSAATSIDTVVSYLV
jgi:hypothetical protein